MPEVSIIIPIYNVEKYLDKCLSSCLNQTFRDIEVICVNDGSSDNSQSIIDRYALADNRIKPITKVNEGVVIARNEGVKNAEGSYLFFLDADDYLSEDAIEILYTEIVKSNADFAKGRYLEVDEFGNSLNIPSIQEKLVRHLNRTEFIDYLSSGLGAMWNILIRKKIYTNIHVNPAVKIGEDLLTLLNLSFNVKCGVFVNHETYFYVQRAGSAMRSDDESKQKNALFYSYIYLCFELDMFNNKNRNRLSNEEAVLISKLICDEITVNLFPEKSLVRKNLPVIAPLYKKHFLYNWAVQKIVFARSWKCSVSMIFYWIKIGGLFS